MLLDQTYFESFSQIELENFYTELAHIKEIFDSGDHAAAYLKRGLVFENLGLTNWAAASHKKAIQIGDQNKDAYLALINLYRILGLYYSEAKLLKDFLDIFPQNFLLLNRLDYLKQNHPRKNVTFIFPVTMWKNILAPHLMPS